MSRVRRPLAGVGLLAAAEEQVRRGMGGHLKQAQGLSFRGRLFMFSVKAELKGETFQLTDVVKVCRKRSFLT